MCTAWRSSPTTPCQPGIDRWMSLGWREHERRCVNTACVRAEPVPWRWHSQEQNHCPLSKSWTGRKKRKGCRVAGEETPFPAAGWEQPLIPALVPTLWKEQQKGKEAGILIQALHQEPSPSHFSIHAPPAGSGSSTEGQSFPQNFPCSLDNCKPLVSWS